MAAGGFKHTLFYTQTKELFGLGKNNFGQCGQNPKKYP